MSGLVRSSLRFHTYYSCPAASNRRAIGVPMLPSPRNPILMAVPVIGAAIHFLASDTNLIIGSAISDDLRSAIPLKTRWELLGIRTFRQERVLSGLATEPASLPTIRGC